MFVLHLILVALNGFVAGLYAAGGDTPLDALLVACHSIAALGWFMLCLIDYNTLKRKLEVAQATAERARKQH